MTNYTILYYITKGGNWKSLPFDDRFGVFFFLLKRREQIKTTKRIIRDKIFLVFFFLFLQKSIKQTNEGRNERTNEQQNRKRKKNNKTKRKRE